jgi:peptidoglycan/xylan/chitin deacetylase (PgdA/CDA1 family)
MRTLSLKQLTLLLLLFVMSPFIARVWSQANVPVAASPAWMAHSPEWDGTYRRIRVPILMYHYVSHPPQDADEYRLDLSVAPELFRDHMEFLFYQGYTPISLYQLHDALMTGTTLPPKPVVLTFDDGYIDHYTNVFPVLREYRYAATFFIITGMPDQSNAGYMSWSQISELAQAGMSIESHTRDHPSLNGRDYDFLVYQLLGAQQSIEHYTGRQPHMFCYPAGRYDDLTLTVLQTMPVWRALTTQNGAFHTTDNVLEMPRLRVSSDTGVLGLARLLETGR